MYSCPSQISPYTNVWGFICGNKPTLMRQCLKGEKLNMTDIQNDEKVFPSIPLTATFEVSAGALEEAIGKVSGGSQVQLGMVEGSLRAELIKELLESDELEEFVGSKVSEHTDVYNASQVAEEAKEKADDLEWRFDDLDLNEFDEWHTINRRVDAIEEDCLDVRISRVERVMSALFNDIYSHLGDKEKQGDSFYASSFGLNQGDPAVDGIVRDFAPDCEGSSDES